MRFRGAFGGMSVDTHTHLRPFSRSVDGDSCHLGDVVELERTQQVAQPRAGRESMALRY